MKNTEQQTLINYIDYKIENNIDFIDFKQLKDFIIDEYYTAAIYFVENNTSLKTLFLSFLQNMQSINNYYEDEYLHQIDEIKTEFFQYLKTLN